MLVLLVSALMALEIFVFITYTKPEEQVINKGVEAATPEIPIPYRVDKLEGKVKRLTDRYFIQILTNLSERDEILAKVEECNALVYWITKSKAPPEANFIYYYEVSHASYRGEVQELEECLSESFPDSFVNLLRFAIVEFPSEVNVGKRRVILQNSVVHALIFPGEVEGSTLEFTVNLILYRKRAQVQSAIQRPKMELEFLREEMKRAKARVKELRGFLYKGKVPKDSNVDLNEIKTQVELEGGTFSYFPMDNFYFFSMEANRALWFDAQVLEAWATGTVEVIECEAQEYVGKEVNALLPLEVNVGEELDGNLVLYMLGTSVKGVEFRSSE